jgi:hypothetical protein
MSAAEAAPDIAIAATVAIRIFFMVNPHMKTVGTLDSCVHHNPGWSKILLRGSITRLNSNKCAWPQSQPDKNGEASVH